MSLNITLPNQIQNTLYPAYEATKQDNVDRKVIEPLVELQSGAKESQVGSEKDRAKSKTLFKSYKDFKEGIDNQDKNSQQNQHRDNHQKNKENDNNKGVFFEQHDSDIDMYAPLYEIWNDTTGKTHVKDNSKSTSDLTKQQIDLLVKLANTGSLPKNVDKKTFNNHLQNLRENLSGPPTPTETHLTMLKRNIVIDNKYNYSYEFRPLAKVDIRL